MRRPIAVLAAVAALALPACSTQDQDALSGVRESASALGDELASSAADARDRLDEIAPDVSDPVDASLAKAEEAAKGAEEALANAGGELDAAARERLEAARTSLDTAQADLAQAASGVPDQLREVLAAVDREIDALRARIEEALSQ